MDFVSLRPSNLLKEELAWGSVYYSVCRELHGENVMYVVSLSIGKTCRERKHAETHHLDPVPIRVQDESDISHLTVCEALSEWHAESLEACASGLDIGHGDRNVTESLRLGIARVVWRRLERLRAVVVGKLEDA